MQRGLIWVIKKSKTGNYCLHHFFLSLLFCFFFSFWLSIYPPSNFRENHLQFNKSSLSVYTLQPKNLRPLPLLVNAILAHTHWRTYANSSCGKANFSCLWNYSFHIPPPHKSFFLENLSPNDGFSIFFASSTAFFHQTTSLGLLNQVTNPYRYIKWPPKTYFSLLHFLLILMKEITIF